MKSCLSLLCFYLFFLTTAAGQSCTVTQAQTYISVQNWDSAVWCLDKYLTNSPGDSTAYFLKGYSLVQSGKYQQALKSLNLAEKHHYPTTVAIHFNQAKCHAQMNKSKKALQMLSQLTDNGFGAFARLNDQEFTPLHQDPGFKDIYAKAELNAFPCMKDPNHRKFDFWLGEWDVYVNGQLAGTNSITLAKGGCAIHENWEATGGSHTGQSINYYHPVDKIWMQNWVGSGQDITTYKEIDSGDGRMQFQGENLGPNGVNLSRMTFTLQEDGSVRQYMENSTDKGLTWIGGFDGKYVRKKK